MCGIAGIFGRTDPDTVRLMLESLIHRGPDDGHQVHGRGFALGARRLSILDLAAGRQPMVNESGTIWAAQNGEFYNFPTLRQQLSDAGHRLQTQCDTELLPHLYEEHGDELPRRIDGMFALAVWDAELQVGLLARDRLGKKPLYYYEGVDGLYFASEIKALLRIPGFERRLNLEALHHFLSYKHVPHPLTSFEGIHMLPPAHLLTFRPGCPIRLSRYWQLPVEEAPVGTATKEEDLIERLLGLLREGVQRRLLADVPIGFFLSGGLDSSLVTAMAAELSPSRIKTFTLTYADGAGTPGKQQDRQWATWVAQQFGTEHHEEEITVSDFPTHFRSAIGAFDEMFSGVISTYFLARLISRHVKVALAGDGADELFGSYLSHRLAFPVANFAAYRQTGDPDLIRPFENDPEYLTAMADQSDWGWRSHLFVFTEAEKRALYAPETRAALVGCNTVANLRASFRGLTGNDALNRILKAECRTQLPDQVLAFTDRLSMAHGLEVRSPFLETTLVEFASRLPGCWKIRNGETKYLLKRAALRYLPQEMVCRPKEGFVMPVNAWLMRGLEDYVRQTLSPRALRGHGLFRIQRIQRLIDEFYAGRREHANKVLSLLAFQEWYELYRPVVRWPVGRKQVASD